MSVRVERLSMMLGGYAIACMAAGGVWALLMLLYSILTKPISADPADVPLLTVFYYIVLWGVATYFTGLILAMCIAIFAFLPSVLLIGLGEFLSIRLRVYYATAGSIVGLTTLITPLSPAIVPTDHRQWPHTSSLIAVAVSGFVGGLAYWAFAGQEASGSIVLCRNVRYWFAAARGTIDRRLGIR